MDFIRLWEEKRKNCKDLLGSVTSHNFKDDLSFEVISNKTSRNFTKDTKFQAASLSKLVGVIVCALYLETQQKSLNFSLYGKLQIPVLEKTTLKHLFSHSAGINVSGFPGYERMPIPNIKEVINGVGQVNTDPIRQSLKFGKYSYSGGGFCLAQEYIERISGRSIGEIAVELLFNPLHLANTTFNILQNDITCAEGYNKKGEKIGLGWHLYPETMAAGLWTTPCEYLKILNELIRGYYNESNIISENTANEILSPVVDYEENNKQYKYAAGISLWKNFYWHSGSNKGYKNLFAFNLADRKIFVIMSNDDNGGEILTL